MPSIVSLHTMFSSCCFQDFLSNCHMLTFPLKCLWVYIFVFIFWGSMSSSWVCKKCVCVLRGSVMSDCLQPHGLQPARLLCPWGFSRQGYWSGLPCPLPGDLIQLRNRTLGSFIAGRFFTIWATREAWWSFQPLFL